MTSCLKLTLDLGSNFRRALNKEMAKELVVAQEKWSVEVTTAEAKAIYAHTLHQLNFRVRSFSGNSSWDLEPELTYFVKGLDGEYSLPSDEAKAAKIYLVRTSDAWVVDPDSNEEDSVKLVDFLDVIKQEIFTWARTGVFYGVGSYKNT